MTEYKVGDSAIYHGTEGPLECKITGIYKNGIVGVKCITVDGEKEFRTETLQLEKINDIPSLNRGNEILYLSREYNKSMKDIYKCAIYSMKNPNSSGLEISFGNFEDLDRSTEYFISIIVDEYRTHKDYNNGLIEYIDILPDDMIDQILLGLNPRDLANLCSVNKRVNKRCSEHIFRTLYMKRNRQTIYEYLLEIGFPYDYEYGRVNNRKHRGLYIFNSIDKRIGRISIEYDEINDVGKDIGIEIIDDTGTAFNFSFSFDSILSLRKITKESITNISFDIDNYETYTRMVPKGSSREAEEEDYIQTDAIDINTLGADFKKYLDKIGVTSLFHNRLLKDICYNIIRYIIIMDKTLDIPSDSANEVLYSFPGAFPWEAYDVKKSQYGNNGIMEKV